jgi:hypothetical protein
MKTIATIIFVVSTLISIPTQASLIKFDVGSLTGFFTFTPLTGSFVLDTNDQSVSEITLMSGARTFDSGSGIDNASGFGLPQTSFLFEGAVELLFEISGIDRFMPGLAAEQSITVEAFISQADNFNDDFQNPNPFSANADIFQGNISATRLSEVSAPAGLSFMAMFFGGIFFIKRHQVRKEGQ